MTCCLALPTTKTSSLKRHAPQTFNDIDSENIDPLLFLTQSKKSKAFDFDSSKLDKAPRFTLAASEPIRNADLSQAGGLKRKADDPIHTHNAQIKRRTEPAAALPAPAGRSPKHKRIGILQRRRATASSVTRINPPEASSNAPFSLNAALAGTVSLKPQKKKVSKKAWDFDIYEDSEAEDAANMMQHQTCTLDISDDESRMSPSKGDRDNKENVPPADYNSAMNAPITRRDLMTDEIRSPLGDLDAKDFYAEGCDANSFIIVPQGELEHTQGKVIVEPHPEDLSTPTPLEKPEMQGQQGWEDVLTHMSAKEDENVISADNEGVPHPEEPLEIKIWESESAKGDEETAEAIAQQETFP